ncbi:hypothetical protein EDC01DRAFT_630629 [Geopyxis carbonaria]|nr:hypothetical protein EDC01DRAFT_630629 [Geopyxis carbonaria]
MWEKTCSAVANPGPIEAQSDDDVYIVSTEIKQLPNPKRRIGNVFNNPARGGVSAAMKYLLSGITSEDEAEEPSMAYDSVYEPTLMKMWKKTSSAIANTDLVDEPKVMFAHEAIKSPRHPKIRLDTARISIQSKVVREEEQESKPTPDIAKCAKDTQSQTRAPLLAVATQMRNQIPQTFTAVRLRIDRKRKGRVNDNELPFAAFDVAEPVKQDARKKLASFSALRSSGDLNTRKPWAKDVTNGAESDSCTIKAADNTYVSENKLAGQPSCMSAEQRGQSVTAHANKDDILSHSGVHRHNDRKRRAEEPLSVSRDEIEAVSGEHSLTKMHKGTRPWKMRKITKRSTV